MPPAGAGYAQSIATLAQAGEWDDVRLRYPRPYADAVAEAGKLSGLPADWIWSVMRQESLFRKDAVSRADARGLMQMLPSTAAAGRPPLAPRAAPQGGLVRAFAGRASGSGPTCANCSIVTRTGWCWLSRPTTPGPAPVARWRPPASMDADVWMENIPYSETRAYVQRILEHIVAFAWVRDAEPPPLRELMPAIEPAAPVL